MTIIANRQKLNTQVSTQCYRIIPCPDPLPDPSYPALHLMSDHQGTQCHAHPHLRLQPRLDQAAGSPGAAAGPGVHLGLWLLGETTNDEHSKDKMKVTYFVFFVCMNIKLLYHNSCSTSIQFHNGCLLVVQPFPYRKSSKLILINLSVPTTALSTVCACMCVHACHLRVFSSCVAVKSLSSAAMSTAPRSRTRLMLKAWRESRGGLTRVVSSPGTPVWEDYSLRKRKLTLG